MLLALLIVLYKEEMEMAKKIGQIRYYGPDSNNSNQKRNYPEDLTSASLRYGNIFNTVYPIVQLGV